MAECNSAIQRSAADPQQIVLVLLLVLVLDCPIADYENEDEDEDEDESFEGPGTIWTDTWADDSVSQGTARKTCLRCASDIHEVAAQILCPLFAAAGAIRLNRT